MNVSFWSRNQPRRPVAKRDLDGSDTVVERRRVVAKSIRWERVLTDATLPAPDPISQGVLWSRMTPLRRADDLPTVGTHDLAVVVALWFDDLATAVRVETGLRHADSPPGRHQSS